jgi:hypothetical protein
MRLDNYETFPAGMQEYLRNYGWHFSKRMCQWAVEHMTDRNGNKIKPYDLNKVNMMMSAPNLQLKNDKGYDKVFVANMAQADFLGNSLMNEMQVARYVKDYIDDPDGYDGLPFTRFYADCIGSGTPIEWEDMFD